jgi:hypothetical protein
MVNLHTTLREIEGLFARYQRMGQHAWLRMELSLANLSALREKFTVHIELIDQYISNLTLGALGRMELVMLKIFELMQEDIRQSRERARAIVSATGTNDPQTWDRLEIELQSEDISLEYCLTTGKIPEAL